MSQRTLEVSAERAVEDALNINTYHRAGLSVHPEAQASQSCYETRPDVGRFMIK